MFKNLGYDRDGRDLIAEAGRVARGETMMQAEGAHLRALINTIEETLTLILEDYDSLEGNAVKIGRRRSSRLRKA